MFQELKRKNRRCFVTVFLHRKEKDKILKHCLGGRGQSIIRGFSLLAGGDDVLEPTPAKVE